MAEEGFFVSYYIINLVAKKKVQESPIAIQLQNLKCITD